MGWIDWIPWLLLCDFRAQNKSLTSTYKLHCDQGCARDFQKTKISNLEYRIFWKKEKSRISNLGDFEKPKISNLESRRFWKNPKSRISNLEYPRFSKISKKSRKNLENIIRDSKRKYEKSDFLFEFLNFILLLFLL